MQVARTVVIIEREAELLCLVAYLQLLGLQHEHEEQEQGKVESILQKYIQKRLKSEEKVVRITNYINYLE